MKNSFYEKKGTKTTNQKKKPKQNKTKTKPTTMKQLGKRYRSLRKQFGILEINNILEQNNYYTSTLVIKH